MSTSLRRTVVVTAASLGVAVLLVWATVAGPTRLVETTSYAGTDAPAQVQRPPGSTDDVHRDATRPRDEMSRARAWASDLVTVLALIAGLWVSAVILRGLLVRLAERLPDKQLVLDVDTLPERDLDAAREAVAGDAARHRDLLEGSDVRNGIVECWVLLEEAAARAGVVRLPSETATEFVVRFLHALDVDPRPVAALAGLYHEARFSTHPLGEDARLRARAALDGIHRELVGERDVTEHLNEHTARRWVGRALVALGAAALVNAVLTGLDLAHDTVLITLLAATTVAAIALAVEAMDATVHLPWSGTRSDARPTSGEDTRTAMFRHMVEVHATSYDHDDTVLWQIADLAAQRLRQVHGIRYADDPERATALLGPTLAGWVSLDRRSRHHREVPHVRYSPAALGEVLDRIEAL